MSKSIIMLIFVMTCVVIISVTIATYFKTDPTDRTLSDGVLQLINEDIRKLEQEKITLEREKIRLATTKVRDKTHAIPFWRTFKTLTAISSVAVVCTSMLILAIYYGHSHLRKHSIVTQKVGNSEVKVHYLMLKHPQFALYCAQVNEIEAIRAHAPDTAIEMLLKLQATFIQQIRAMAGRRGLLSLPEPPMQDLPTVQPVHDIPTFRDILDDLSEGDEMVLGYDLDTGKEIRGSFDDLYSSFLAGKTRSGKSSWLRGLMLQSIRCYPGVRFYVLDPHRNHPDGLSNSLPKTKHFHFLDPTRPRQGFYQFNRQLQARLDHSNGASPLIFVCDELAYCSKQPYANSLQALFDRISTEGAKAKCYLLASSQDTRTKKGLDFRDTLSSCYVFDLKRSQASYLLQDKDEVAKHQRVRDLKERGVCLFVPTEDESQAVKVPYCSPGDVHYFATTYTGNRSGNSTQTIRKHRRNTSDTVQETPGNENPVSNDGNTPGNEVLPDATLLTEIETYMRDHDLSLSKFADLVGMNKGYLSQCLKGEKRFSEDSREKLMRVIKEERTQDQEM